jgi:hypothetical protein
VISLSVADEKGGQRRRKTDGGDAGGGDSMTATKKKNAPAPEVGTALRSAYQRTLDEDIPPEMLDLLGKLG